MSRNNKGFFLFCFVPKCKKPDLIGQEFCPEFPNISIKLFKKFRVINIPGFPNIVDYLFSCFVVKSVKEFLCPFQKYYGILNHQKLVF